MCLIAPNIWPINRKDKAFEAPFYGRKGEVPFPLTIILGLQHALSSMGSAVPPPLAVASGAFYLDAEQTQYLVSASFITAGIAI